MLKLKLKPEDLISTDEAALREIAFDALRDRELPTTDFTCRLVVEYEEAPYETTKIPGGHATIVKLDDPIEINTPAELEAIKRTIRAILVDNPPSPNMRKAYADYHLIFTRPGKESVAFWTTEKQWSSSDEKAARFTTIGAALRDYDENRQELPADLANLALRKAD